MRLSILIPVLNESSRVAEAVRRAFDIGCDELQVAEVLVIDGGSHDDSVNQAEASGATVIRSEAGRGQQLATGARAATGELILMLHVDNWLAAESASQVVAALKDEGVEAGAFWQRIEATGYRYRALEWGNAMRVRWFGLAYGDQAIFVRRSVLEAIGGIPELPLMEDVALMRLLKRRKRPVLLSGPVHVSPRRWQENGIIRQTLKNWFLLSAYTIGFSVERIARWYRPPNE